MNLNIGNVRVFRLVGMIFTLGLAIAFLRIEYIVSHAYIYSLQTRNYFYEKRFLGNWGKANLKDKDQVKYSTSSDHITSMIKWQEYKDKYYTNTFRLHLG